LLVALAAIQFLPIDRTNPPVQNDLEVSAAVKVILRSSCYDCHSNETRWPWYSHLAPASWLVTHDVHEARRKFNFSSWGLLDQKRIQHLKEHMWEEVSAGDMPPGTYLFAHPDARLTPQALATLKQWLQPGPDSG
jgi:hypothetical protein